MLGDRMSRDSPGHRNIRKPAFSGLFAPYWRPDARGAIVGLSRFNTKEHLARATLEAICHQSADVVLVPRAGRYPLKCGHTLHKTFGMSGQILVD